MNHLWQDTRSGWRLLVKHPVLSLTAILAFGLGIGLTTTVFSIVNGVMFKGLPIERSDRVVSLRSTKSSENQRNLPVSVQDFAQIDERQTAFEDLGCFSIGATNLAIEGGQPERYSTGLFSAGAFRVFGVKPLLGRTFRQGEDRRGAEPVVVLGYEVWRDRFGGSPDILGKSVRANGVNRTVVGVMPEGFEFPAFEKLWIPLELEPAATKRGEGPSYQVVARLKPGVSIKEARAQVSAIAAQIEREHPDTNQGISAAVFPYMESFVGPQIYALLYTMFGAGVGVLLIACVNVANLLLARASLRAREVAVRMALGAGRGRIITQLLVEVFILALVGGIVGLILSLGAMKWFVTAIAVNPPPFWMTFELDYRVMAFVVAVTFAASVLAGVVPAAQATRTNVSDTLKDESRASTGFRIGRFSGALVVAEVAVSCGLLIAAGLMIKSVAQLKTVRMPFTTDNIFTARINLPRLQYPDDASCIGFYEKLLPKLQSMPGVLAATLSDGLPAAGNGTVPVQIDGQAYSRDSDYPIVREGDITPGYFETFQTRMLEGREFTPSDRAGSLPVAIINESMARTYFRGKDPIGLRLRKGRRDTKFSWLTIVGVAPDMLMEGIGNSGQSPVGYYIPIAQSDVTNFVSIAVRTRGEPSSVTQDVRSAVASLNADLAIYQVLSMKEVIGRQTWFYKVFGTLFVAFGCSALFLALAGLYGVMSFAVSQRTREMGIRTALGAKGGQLVRLVMRRGALQLAVGLVAGLGLGFLALNPLQFVLYKVQARDPTVFITVVAALALAGLLAGFLPAYRVTKIDPVKALAEQ